MFLILKIADLCFVIEHVILTLEYVLCFYDFYGLMVIARY